LNNEPEAKSKKMNLRLGAWLPWLPVIIYGCGAIWFGQGYGDFVVPLILYFPVSMMIGVVVMIWYRRDPVVREIVIVLFFCVPIIAIFARFGSARYSVEQSKHSREKMYELCQQHARAVVYKTVENVEGVVATNHQDRVSMDRVGRFDIDDPWYQREMYHAARGILGPRNNGYLYFEAKLHSAEEHSKVKRAYLSFSGADERKYSKLTLEQFSFSKKVVIDDSVRSKFGWKTTNLTTKEMRDRWIAGGRIEIFDLETDEVLGELTSFYRGAGAVSSGDSWRGSLASDRSCEGVPLFYEFLRTVLVPRQFHTKEEIGNEIEKLNDEWSATSFSSRRFP